MPLIDDLKELLSQNSTIDRMIAICKQYGIALTEENVLNIEYLKTEFFQNPGANQQKASLHLIQINAIY